jgi:hypothetical protein
MPELDHANHEGIGFALVGNELRGTVTGAGPLTINAQTGTTYTLALTDANGDALLTLNNANPVAVTIPAEATVAFPVGSVVSLLQTGAGLVTVTAAAGVTLNGASAGSKDLAGQWASAALVKLGSDAWAISGGVAGA